MAVRQHMPACDLRLWARRLEALQEAQQLQIIDTICPEIQSNVQGAQLVILATPISSFAGIIDCISSALAPGTIVTDVGSVKGYVHSSIGSQLTEKGHLFIGSHPMAGGEKQGLRHARAELLQGAVVALTNAEHAPQGAVDRLAAFWQALGCRTCEMPPALHDETVARISHAPHVLAALCARTAMRGNAPVENLQQLASTGFRDTTRVSSGGASMWADILWSNSDAVCAALQDSIDDLHHLITLLKTQDKEAVCAWLEGARSARETVRATAPAE